MIFSSGGIEEKMLPAASTLLAFLFGEGSGRLPVRMGELRLPASERLDGLDISDLRRARAVRTLFG